MNFHASAPSESKGAQRREEMEFINWRMMDSALLSEKPWVLASNQLIKAILDEFGIQ